MSTQFELPDNVQLRKRTGRTRERSKDPVVRRTNLTASPTINAWDAFKDMVQSKYPDIQFPDEYEEDGVVSSSINNVDIDEINDIVKMSRGALTFLIEDGRVIIEFNHLKTIKQDDNSAKKKVVPIKNILLVLLWVLLLVFTIRFIILNREKYMKLLKI